MLERFKQNGQGDAAESWISKGANRELPPPQLKQAIGADVLAALEQQRAYLKRNSWRDFHKSSLLPLINTRPTDAFRINLHKHTEDL